MRLWINVLLVLILIIVIVAPVVQANDEIEFSELNSPFSLDSSSNGYQLPKGSIIHHLENGNTVVTGQNGKELFKTKDSLVGYVSTPNGPSKACYVYNVPSDTILEGNDKTVNAYHNGELILQVIFDNQEKVLPNAMKSQQDRQIPGMDENYWIECAYDISSLDIDYFTALWQVPSSPTTDDEEVLIYLFNAIEIYPGIAIIQPVLEWNYGGSGSWSCAAWHVWWYGQFRATNAVSASTGNIIRGTMAHTGSQWYISIINNSTGQYSNLYSNMFGTSYLYAFCTLEGWNVDANEDVPGDTTFYSMSIRYDGDIVDVDWGADYNPPPNVTNLNVQIYSDTMVKLHTAN